MTTLPDCLPPRLLRNGHLHTIVVGGFRRARVSGLVTTFVATPDGEHLALDWSRVGGRTLAVLSHGLEGSSRRPYMLGMMRALNAAGIDTVAWNGRGCGASSDLALKPHHAGAIDDLGLVVDSALAAGSWDRLVLTGFSLGGNMSLLAAARESHRWPRLVGVVAISAPCDLSDSVDALSRGAGLLYTRIFLRTLKAKMRRKAQRFPGKVLDGPLAGVRTLRTLDDLYIAPLAGFGDAETYYRECSSRPLLPSIEVPSLIVNAQDDPFLAGGAYPVDEASRNPRVVLEMPSHGGHVGFALGGGRWWSEERTVAFIRALEAG